MSPARGVFGSESTPMKASSDPIVKDLVLVGGGHSHVAVLKNFGMKPVPGVRLTLIARDVHTPYSGMLPGYVAGHYTFDEVHVDLRPLCQFAGARLYHDEAIGLDLANKKVLCSHRPSVAFDLLSINNGSTPTVSNVPGAAGSVTPVKPIDQFVERWQRLSQRVLDNVGPSRIVVVGAGAGGVEILLAIQYRLHHLLENRGRDANELEFHLICQSETILDGFGPHVGRRFERVLAERGVHVHRGNGAAAVRDGELELVDGTRLRFDEILWVTEAGAAPWIKESGLATDDAGFVAVHDTLQSASHPDVFAAGDTAAVRNHPRPKAGVFAVRQGKPLARNLRRALRNRPLKPFTPQRTILALVTTGDKYAVAAKAGFSAEGALLWRWKDWIDRRWMAKYADLPEMKEDEKSNLDPKLAGPEALKQISAIAMRCGGCGAKVGADVLTRALSELDPVSRPDVLVGLKDPDDAAVVDVPAGKVMVHTVDYFRAFIDDPYVFGQVAANHSLSDIFAMGAEPQSALAIATVPYGIEAKVEETLNQLMAGAITVLDECGTALVGGHTSEGAELALGFSVNGLGDRDRIMRKAGMQPGDLLILTKPLGTGTLFAADMQQKAKGRWIDQALQSMVQSNRRAADCLHGHDATACTDITGFGLLGHMVEMIRASGVDVDIELGSLPILDGAMETVRLGILSSLQPANVRLRRAVHNLEEAGNHERYPIIFDPQTSGGLLASVPDSRVGNCLDELHEMGYEQAAVIGRVKPESNHLEPVTVLA